MSEWQLIDTAPKDGTRILVFNGLGNMHVAKWGRRFIDAPEGTAWVTGGKLVGGGVTPWMPLPPAPDEIVSKAY